MKRSKSSHRWLQAHHSDPFVKQARSEGYRSRAVYKLKEVDEKYNLIRSDSTVLELGAAPGGWTQYVVERLSEQGRVIAVDCLTMDPLPHVSFVQGDFTEEPIQQRIFELVGEQGADVLLSDMAPNLSGVKAMDGMRTIALAEITIDAVGVFLKRGGVLFMKVFHGPGFDALIKQVRQNFSSVSIRKPSASRSQSRETYLLARGYRL